MKSLPQVVAMLYLTLFIAFVLSIAAPAQTVPQLKDGVITGAGFTITLPPDVSPEIGANTESTHGFYFELPPRGSDQVTRPSDELAYRYISFDTNWDLGDMPSLDAVVSSITSNLVDAIPASLTGAGNIVLEASLPARLGTLPARRLVFKYRNREKKPAIRQLVVAYNARKDAAAIVYELVLNTTQENFQADVSVFAKIMAGFKATNQ